MISTIESALYIGLAGVLAQYPTHALADQGNTSYGLDALANANFYSSYNSAFGEQSLSSITDGDFNTAIGYFSLQLNTTGYKNTASGAYALASARPETGIFV